LSAISRAGLNTGSFISSLRENSFSRSPRANEKQTLDQGETPLLKSMTAFARGQASGGGEDVLIEIHSVNSRRLEIVTNLPGDLTEFDPPLRKLVSDFLTRGRVTVHVSVRPNAAEAPPFQADTTLARQLKAAYDELRTALGYSGPVDFSILASRPELIAYLPLSEDPAKRWETVQAAARGALERLVSMKQAEGDNLRPVFENCLAHLHRTTAAIRDAASGAVEKQTQKLQARIADIAPNLGDNDERILREIVILADKLDLAEELDRLDSHLSQFRVLMDEAKPCGRTMDFLVQEMNREVNTIGAKAADLTISQLVVEAKVQLEMMREQAQNIE
jgi:uncharacterized protein (TIGR00255 family)